MTFPLLRPQLLLGATLHGGSGACKHWHAVFDYGCQVSAQRELWQLLPGAMLPGAPLHGSSGACKQPGTHFYDCGRQVAAQR